MKSIKAGKCELPRGVNHPFWPLVARCIQCFANENAEDVFLDVDWLRQRGQELKKDEEPELKLLKMLDENPVFNGWRDVDILQVSTE